mmetsp:Transcript_112197/g.362275  ORF Transcript_112197/g.362275 Transcript_112197/m.362275 type:complete len:203 (-) Transcript_112197:1377-1985(-)
MPSSLLYTARPITMPQTLYMASVSGVSSGALLNQAVCESLLQTNMAYASSKSFLISTWKNSRRTPPSSSPSSPSKRMRSGKRMPAGSACCSLVTVSSTMCSRRTESRKKVRASWPARSAKICAGPKRRSCRECCLTVFDTCSTFCLKATGTRFLWTINTQAQGGNVCGTSWKRHWSVKSMSAGCDKVAPLANPAPTVCTSCS